MKLYYFTYKDLLFGTTGAFDFDGFLFETPVGFICYEDYLGFSEWDSAKDFEDHKRKLHCLTFEMIRLQ